MKDWIKAGAKNKHKFIPEGQKEVSMIFATDVLFIDTEYLPGYGPEPKKVTPTVAKPASAKPSKPKKKSKKKSRKKSKKKSRKKK